jgi:flagellar biosynthesis protein FlhG
MQRTTDYGPRTIVMPDQAEKLRLLVTTALPVAEVVGDGLPMIVVTGGRASVGATTVALNLAAVLADRGERVLLVDAAQQRNDVVEPAGVRREVVYGLSDVLAGKCDVDAAIVPGPVGVRILPSRGRASLRLGSPSRRDAAISRDAQQRLMDELQSLDDDFDLIVVDAGRGCTPWSRRLWSRAKLIVLVTTPEDAAVLDAYAVMKRCAVDAERWPVRLLVNLAESDTAADDAQRRMDQACQRFLSRAMPALPALPRHRASEFTGVPAAPRVWEMPNTPFGHAALWFGRAVSDVLAEEHECACATAGMFSGAA